MDAKHVKLSIIGFAILLIGFVGVTYSFFNYTRTGSANSLGTGNIYFSFNQGTTLNITNVFPMTSTEATNADLDTMTITIEGNTTYVDGEEFEVSIIDVQNILDGKKIPLKYIATYEPTSENTIGSSNNDYWNARNDKDNNIYNLNTTGNVFDGKQILTGYIDNGTTGISGILTIKAYIDADRIAITDTYNPNQEKYIVNPNMTEEDVDDCVSYLSGASVDIIRGMCQGTLSYEGYYLVDMINRGWFNQTEIDYFVTHNIIIERTYTDDTTTEWVDGRVIVSTEEWNSISTTPISFKIHVESNEGIWTSDGTIPSCPGCKYIFTTTGMYTTWNTQSKTPTTLLTGLYDSYFDVDNNYFLGVILNEQNQATKAYACGIKDKVPFCIEGTRDGSKYETNNALLQEENLWNNTCTEYLAIDTGYGYDYLDCGSWEDSLLATNSRNIGRSFVGSDYSNYCYVVETGKYGCYDSK